MYNYQTMNTAPALSHPLTYHSLITSDFRTYLKQSVTNPATLDLSNRNLLDVIEACAKVKNNFHPKFKANISSLIYNLRIVENEYGIPLKPSQVSDIFYGYFISFCEKRGLKISTIKTMCSQLRAILSWAAKYNANVSPTYTDFNIRQPQSHEIALTADEVSRITYFDIDLFYADRRKDFKDTMHRVRDMFVLSCNLFQRHSDCVRITPSCFNRNIFTITQQKTGAVATVDIDRYSIDPKTTYRILERYNYTAPYTASIGNYNWYLHHLMKDIGFTEEIKKEEYIRGNMVVKNIPKWKAITSHTARRTAVTIGVLRGHNIHALRKCTGHYNLSVFGKYIKDE